MLAVLAGADPDDPYSRRGATGARRLTRRLGVPALTGRDAAWTAAVAAAPADEIVEATSSRSSPPVDCSTPARGSPSGTPRSVMRSTPPTSIPWCGR